MYVIAVKGNKASIVDSGTKAILFGCNKKEIERHLIKGGTAASFVSANYNPVPGLDVNGILELLETQGFVPDGTAKVVSKAGRKAEFVVKNNTLYRNGKAVLTKAKLDEIVENKLNVANELKTILGMGNPYKVITSYLIPSGMMTGKTKVCKNDKGEPVVVKSPKITISWNGDQMFLNHLPINLVSLNAKLKSGKALRHIAREFADKIPGANLSSVVYRLRQVIDKDINLTRNACTNNPKRKSVSSVKQVDFSDIPEITEEPIVPPAIRIVKATLGKANTQLGNAITFLAQLNADKLTDDNVLKVIELAAETAVDYPVIAKMSGLNVDVLQKRIAEVKKTHGMETVDSKLNRFLVNKDIINLVKPSSVLELCTGPVSFYKIHHPGLRIVSNEADVRFSQDTNLDPAIAAAKAVAQGESYDLVDIDSDKPDIYYAIMSGIKAANKAISISIPIRQTQSVADGGHTIERLKAQYGITATDSGEACLTKFKNEVKRLGRSVGKELSIVSQEQFGGVTRLVYTIS